MIFISINNEAEIDFKNNFPDHSIIFIDLIENKKNIRELLLEAITRNNIFLNTKTIYAFQNCSELTNKLISFLFKEYEKISHNKDIYLLGMKNHQFYVNKNFKHKFKYYNPSKPIKTYEENFFSDLKKAITMNKNRTNLLDYQKLLPPFKYILNMISYNFAYDTSFSYEEMMNNMEILIKINSYFELKGYNKDIIEILLDNCYQPLYLKKINFPKRKNMKIIHDKSIKKIDDAEKIISKEFMNEFTKIEKKSKISMF